MWREGGGVRLCASGGVGCVGLGPDWRHMQSIFAGLLWMESNHHSLEVQGLQDAAPSWAQLYVSHRARYLLARCGCGSIVWQLCTVRLWASCPLFPFLLCAAVIRAEQSSVVLFVWCESITLQRPRLWVGILLSIPLTGKIALTSKRSGVCVAGPGYT